MKSVNYFQENRIKINDLNTNYKIIGNGDIPIILLHGWGLNSDKYIDTAKQFMIHDSRFMILIPDLPGFGKSDNPPKAWSVDEYVEFVKSFIETVLCHSEPFVFTQGKLREESPTNVGLGAYAPDSSVASLPQNDINKQLFNLILIGHSFGGRIAIKFAAKYPEKLLALILTGAAGIKHPLSIKQKFFFIAAKTGKIIFSLPLIKHFQKRAQKLLYKAAREKDYYEAQGVMKETFKKVIVEDLTPCLDKIKIPTLLIWGDNDKSTPLSDGQLMYSKVKNSLLRQGYGGQVEFKIVNEANHSLPYQKSEEFAKIVLGFIKKSKHFI